MNFLGCLDDVTEGILAGYWDGDEWVLEVNSSYVAHGTVPGDKGQPAAAAPASASRGGEGSGSQEE